MGILTRALVRDGVLTLTQLHHHPDCQGPNRGHQEALTLSTELGDVRSADSLVARFPDWSSVLECYTLVGDATYKASPKGLYQLYTLHAKFASPSGSSEWIAVAFALMGSKSKAAHAVVFNAILSKWAELGCLPKFTKFLVVFDSAQLDAVAAAFGTDKVKGCLFHQTQAIIREVKFEGLMRYYNGAFGSKNLIWWWLHHICALPFLPPSNSAFFEKCFVIIMSDLELVQVMQRTTLDHPSLTIFVPWLQEIHSRQQTRMVQLQAGATPRPKDQRYVWLDQWIAVYKTNFQVIDSYLALIKGRSQLVSRECVYAFLTHFNTMLCSRGYTSARSWVKVDIFSHDLLFFPINDQGNHWTLIVVDMRL
uniref:Ubiquitin-like protease family profile domain-containing protein n=1 Tax=Plectus sambesii TaxID=2011161 RepID=A0A914X875_9BILA